MYVQQYYQGRHRKCMSGRIRVEYAESLNEYCYHYCMKRDLKIEEDENPYLQSLIKQHGFGKHELYNSLSHKILSLSKDTNGKHDRLCSTTNLYQDMKYHVIEDGS